MPRANPASLLASASLLLLCSACGPKPRPVLEVRPVISRCPAYPLPPAELIRRPARTDFLSPSATTAPSTPPNSTN